MRVAIFTESYEPIVNGVSVSVATLRNGLVARGHDVFIFAPRFPGHEDGDGNHIYRFPSLITRLAKGYPIPIPYAPKIWRMFHDLRPDIVHTQTPFFLGVAGMRWANRVGVPIVSTNHTLYTEYLHYLPFVPKPLTKTVLLWHMRRYYGSCSAVIVPSQPVETALRQYGIKTRIEIIKSGVTVSNNNGRVDVRSEFGIPSDAFLMLYVGRIAQEKNLALLLKSFKAVRDKHPNAWLMIVGSGPYEQHLREYSDMLGVGDGITFTGMVNRNAIGGMYSAADVFVFPSVTETQGLVVCEALMAGLPCVAVRAAGIPEVVEDGVDGLLTDNTEESFIEAISCLIVNPEIRERLSKGATRNAARFTLGAMAERVEEFYQSEIVKDRGFRI